MVTAFLIIKILQCVNLPAYCTCYTQQKFVFVVARHLKTVDSTKKFTHFVCKLTLQQYVTNYDKLFAFLATCILGIPFSYLYVCINSE